MASKYSLVKKIFSLYVNPLKTIPLSPRTIARLAATTWSAFRAQPLAAYPAGLFLEPSANCNLKCTTCVTVDYRTRNKGFMDFEKFRQTVDAVRPVYLVLGGYGEPTLNKNYLDMIRYAKSKRISVKSVTNATTLNEKMAEDIVASGLDLLNISLDGATKETFEKIRKGASFDVVVRNIKLIVAAKKKQGKNKPAINIDMTIFKENVHEIPAMVRLCHAEFGIEPVFSLFILYDKEDKKHLALTDNEEARRLLLEGIEEAIKRGYASSASSLQINLEVLKMKYTKKVTSHCFLPWLGLNLTWDGRAFPCCYYYDCQVDLGNVFEEGFQAVWNGSRFQGFRKTLAQSRGLIKICSVCTIEDEGLNQIFKNAVKICPPLKKLTAVDFSRR